MGPALRMVAFDIDGVIHRGATLLPAAREALQDVLARGLLLRYVTNNSTQHRSAVAARLAGFGLPAGPELILTSGAATATWLRHRLDPGSPVLVVGGGGLVQELSEVDLAPRYAGEVEPAAARTGFSAVVVGLDRGFTYRTLAAAQQALLHGALFVATNSDATFPAEDGLWPGGGALVAAVATAAGRAPVVIGKPQVELARVLAGPIGLSPEEILFVGDRLDTDIAWAHRAGMRSVLVLTGVTQARDLEAPDAPRPDFVLPDLHGLAGVLDELTA